VSQCATNSFQSLLVFFTKSFSLALENRGQRHFVSISFRPYTVRTHVGPGSRREKLFLLNLFPERLWRKARLALGYQRSRRTITTNLFTPLEKDSRRTV
jgi:hypothetical protein